MGGIFYLSCFLSWQVFSFISLGNLAGVKHMKYMCQKPVSP